MTEALAPPISRHSQLSEGVSSTTHITFSLIFQNRLGPGRLLQATLAGLGKLTTEFHCLITQVILWNKYRRITGCATNTGNIDDVHHSRSTFGAKSVACHLLRCWQHLTFWTPGGG